MPHARKSKLTYADVASRVRYVASTGEFFWVSARCKKFIGQPAGHWMQTGYRCIEIDGEKLLAHRVAWLLQTGQWPTYTIDHRDGDSRNNRWDNLREATQRENSFNRSIQSNCKSGVQGVRKKRNKWHAYVSVAGRQINLGVFASLEEAAEARREGALRHHGEFASVARPK